MHSSAKSILEEIPQAALFEKVADICANVNTVITTNDLLERSLKQIMELFGAVRGSIFILKENGRDLVLKSVLGMARAEEEQMIKRLGEGIVGKVAQLKKPIFVDDIANDNRFDEFKARGSYRTPSFICAPLIIKDQLIGVINITDKQTGHRFNKDELQLLDFLASQIALNYRRIELYHKFKLIIQETKELKNKLGQTDEEAKYLKKQIHIHEKLATIGKLAGGIAHEFNNPLDGVMRYTNLSLEHLRDDEVVRGYLLEIKHGLNRMANIVRNLLACSRHEQPLQEKIEFNSALDHALAGLHGEISHKKITIEKKISDKLPLLTDWGLERILSNILRNAADAISQNGTIVIEARVKDNFLVFSIHDNGIGIEPDQLEKIFEPFFTTKNIDKGCGLGLTIVEEIVKTYDGKIDVGSEPKNGTMFTVSLPVK